MSDNSNGLSAVRRRVAANYDYCDENGAVIFRTVRYEPKDFRQCRPDPVTPGKWIYNLKGVSLVLYRRQELRAAMALRLPGHRIVVISEGEKDVDRLWFLGIPATTNAMGAGKWKDDYTDQLVAAGVSSVVVIPHNDPPG